MYCKMQGPTKRGRGAGRGHSTNADADVERNTDADVVQNADVTKSITARDPTRAKMRGRGRGRGKGRGSDHNNGPLCGIGLWNGQGISTSKTYIPFESSMVSSFCICM